MADSPNPSLAGVDFVNYAREADSLFDAEHRRLQETVQGRKLILSLVGNVNSGKSATINAMLGKRYADVSPIAGWTRQVSLYPLPGHPMVLIADTPGLQDVNEEVSKKTEQFVDKDADVILFFINASVGVTRPEREAFLRLRHLARPTLPVVNKIDLLEASDRQVLLDDVRAKLDLDMAKQPLYAVSARTGEGISSLTAAIAALLGHSGKDLLFARVARYKDGIVDRWITLAAAGAFTLAIIPVPGSDTIPLTALQVSLCMKIAYAYGQEATRKEVLPFITELAAGQVGKALFRTVLKLVGWAGGPEGAFLTSTVAAVIAGSMTFGIGKAAQAYYRSGMTLSVDKLKEVFQKGSEEYRRYKSLKEGGSPS